jgi:multidrug efflux system membrane fusion protein
LTTVTGSTAGEQESPEAVGPIRQPPRRGGSAGSPLGNRWVRWGLVLILLLVVAWICWRLFWPSKPARAPAPAVPVGVAVVKTGDMHVTLQGLGTVTPTATVTVQTQINGQLMSVGFKEGQLVSKGQFLAQIDPRPSEAALAQAQGALTHDLGLLNQAQSDLARFVILDKQNSIAKQTVADQQFLVSQDQGTVMEDRANIQAAKLNLIYCHIVSPVAGRVGLRLVDPGNYVQASSSTGLVVVTELQPITAIFVLPEADIPALSAQMQGGAHLPVTAFDEGNTTKIADGELLTVDNTVDTTTGTVKLRATFPNTDLALFPNEFVNAHLLLKTLTNVTEVPVQAVQFGAPGSFVYVLNANSTVSVRVIKVGVTDGDDMQVLSGLTPGEKVVVDGVSLLRDGARVRTQTGGGGGGGGGGSGGRHHHGATNNGPGAPPGEQSQNAKGASGDDRSAASAS